MMPSASFLYDPLAAGLGALGFTHSTLRNRALREPMRLQLLLLAVLPVPLVAQTRDSIVSVSASRTTRVPPDRASFYVIVEGTAEIPADAITRVDSKLKTVTEALKGFGSRVKLDQPIAYGVGPSPSLNGYPGVAV